MIANTLFYRVTEQKTPSGKIVGFNILASFDTRVVYATAAYKESALCSATTEQINTVVLKLASKAGAADTRDLTTSGMKKKIEQNSLPTEELAA